MELERAFKRWLTSLNGLGCERQFAGYGPHTNFLISQDTILICFVP
jgi:hypothetical protein